MAGMIGYEFKVDPVVVLQADNFDWALRVAATKYVQQQREKEADKARQQANRGSKVAGRRRR